MHRKHLAAVSLALAVCALVVFKLQGQVASNAWKGIDLASETELKADLEAVHALHSRDPNFPVVSPSEVDGHAEASAAVHRKWQSVYPMKFSSKTSHSVPENSNAEWRLKEKQMQKAIHVFHKYGDMALEKLLPKTRKPALRHFEPLRVEATHSSKASFSTRNAEEAIKDVENNLKKAQESKIEHLKAREQGLLYEEQTKQQDLTRKFQRELAREKRREMNMKKEMSVISSENNKLQARNSRLSTLIEKSLRARDESQSKIDRLEGDISSMKKAEGRDIANLKEKLQRVEEDNKSLHDHIQVGEDKQLVAAHQDFKEQLRSLPTHTQSKAVDLASTYLSPEYEKDDRTRSFLLSKKRLEQEAEQDAVKQHPVKQGKHEDKAIDLASTYLSPEYEKNDRTRNYLLRKRKEQEAEQDAVKTHPVQEDKQEDRAVDLASTYLSPEYEKRISMSRPSFETRQLPRQKFIERSHCESCVTGPDCLSGCRVASSNQHKLPLHKVKSAEAKPAEVKITPPQPQEAKRIVANEKPVTKASVWGLGWSAIANLFHL